MALVQCWIDCICVTLKELLSRRDISAILKDNWVFMQYPRNIYQEGVLGSIPNEIFNNEWVYMQT